MATTPEADRSEETIQSYELIAKDPVRRNRVGWAICEAVRPKVSSGLFTPDQYRRVLTALNPSELSLSEIEQEVERAQQLPVLSELPTPGLN